MSMSTPHDQIKARYDSLIEHVLKPELVGADSMLQQKIKQHLFQIFEREYEDGLYLYGESLRWAEPTRQAVELYKKEGIPPAKKYVVATVRVQLFPLTSDVFNCRLHFEISGHESKGACAMYTLLYGDKGLKVQIADLIDKLQSKTPDLPPMQIDGAWKNYRGNLPDLMVMDLKKLKYGSRSYIESGGVLLVLALNVEERDFRQGHWGAEFKEWEESRRLERQQSKAGGDPSVVTVQSVGETLETTKSVSSQGSTLSDKHGFSEMEHALEETRRMLNDKSRALDETTTTLGLQLTEIQTLKSRNEHLEAQLRMMETKNSSILTNMSNRFNSLMEGMEVTLASSIVETPLAQVTEVGAGGGIGRGMEQEDFNGATRRSSHADSVMSDATMENDNDFVMLR